MNLFVIKYNLFITRLKLKLLNHILTINNETYADLVFKLVLLLQKLTIKNGTQDGFNQDIK